MFAAAAALQYRAAATAAVSNGTAGMRRSRCTRVIRSLADGFCVLFSLIQLVLWLYLYILSFLPFFIQSLTQVLLNFYPTKQHPSHHFSFFKLICMGEFMNREERERLACLAIDLYRQIQADRAESPLACEKCRAREERRLAKAKNMQSVYIWRSLMQSCEYS